MARNARLIRVAPARPAPPPGAGMLRVRGRAPAYLLARHALMAEDAVPYAPAGRLDRWWFARLVAAGAIRRAPGGWWFDLHAYHAAAGRIGRNAALLAAPLAIAIAAFATLFYVRYS